MDNDLRSPSDFLNAGISVCFGIRVVHRVAKLDVYLVLPNNRLTEMLVLFLCLARQEFKTFWLIKFICERSDLYYSYVVLARLAYVINPIRVLAIAVLNL